MLDRTPSRRVETALPLQGDQVGGTLQSRRFANPRRIGFGSQRRKVQTIFVRLRQYLRRHARLFAASLVCIWLFCDLDSYPLWILLWGWAGPSPPDKGLTHGCIPPDYEKPLAVVVPLIASQTDRLHTSMGIWASPSGRPCSNAIPQAHRPHLLFYFDRPLDEPSVSKASQKIMRFTQDNESLRHALHSCFANVSISSAGLTAAESRNSYRFDVLRNLASTRGSNNQFWASFQVHSQFRHMFYMEPDSWPLRPDWLSRIDQLSRDPSIWMRGTMMRYQPRMVVALEPFRSAYTRHLNGNALYDLHDPCFARYRDLTRQSYGDAAFDVAMANFRMRRSQYRLEHALAHRFVATEVIADLGVERFTSISELREKLPGTFIAHAKFNYV